MTVTRANVEATKALIRARLGNPYVYGGALSANVKQGTDCSEVWQTVLESALGRLQWGRQSEGATTESYRYIPIGGVGPFGTIRVARPQDIPANAVAKLAFHHEGNGGASSHMWGELDGMRIESAGNKGLVTQPQAWEITNAYANAWAYLPGPIAEDGTAATVPEPADTLFADVSEWQAPVTDAYLEAGYRVISIRSNDGTHRDTDWASNYAWCKRAADDGRLAFFIVYFVWRPNWQDAVATFKSQVGQPHPKMAVMLDVESWSGQITGDQSAGINAAFENVAAFVGDRRKVIGYGNTGDLDRLWPSKPPGARLIIAAYGSNPSYPGKIAHQYTDGQGYGGDLPEGAPPFGNCDMNSADGLTATAFAAALGIETSTTGDDFMSALSADEQRLLLDRTKQVWGALFNPIGSASKYKTDGEGDIYTTKDMVRFIDKNVHELLVEQQARMGNPEALALVKREADKGDKWSKVVYDYCVKNAPAQPTPAPAPAPAGEVSCAQGGGGCVLVANGGDGTCALAGNECVLRKGGAL
jgi:hypothetical protein